MKSRSRPRRLTASSISTRSCLNWPSWWRDPYQVFSAFKLYLHDVGLLGARTSDSGNAEVEFVVQGDSFVFPIEAKAGINTKAKSLKVYRDLFAPPFAIRTSLALHEEGQYVKDIPLYAFGTQLTPYTQPSSPDEVD